VARTLPKVDKQYLESSEMWCGRWTEKVSWTTRVRSSEVLRRVKEERNIVQIITSRTANWIGHIFRRNCHLNTLLNKDRGKDRSEGKNRTKT